MKTVFIAGSLAMSLAALEIFDQGLNLDCLSRCLRCNFERNRNRCDDACDCNFINSAPEPEFPDECPES